MKVSIVIPTYEQPESVVQAAESALAQDYPQLEVVVTDDASRPGTLAGLARLRDDPRLRVHRNPENLGRVANYRQALYEGATGDWVLYLDGDDYLIAHDYVSRAMALVAEDERIRLVFARRLELLEDTGALRESPANQGLPRIMEGNDLFLRLDSTRVSLFHLTCLYDRRRAMELDFYRANIQSSDWESIHRLILGAKVGFVDTFAGVRRLHSASATATASYEERIENLVSVTNAYEYARELGAIPSGRLERWRRDMLVRRGKWDTKELFKAGQGDRIPEYLREIRRRSASAWARLLLRPKTLRGIVMGGGSLHRAIAP